MLRSILIVALAGCGLEHRGEPCAPELQPQTAAIAHGERLFHKFCYQCHPNGAAGLGPAINNKPLPALAIKTQIREGVGSMPAFGSDWLSDNEVEDIASYVKALHGAPAVSARRRR